MSRKERYESLQNNPETQSIINTLLQGIWIMRQGRAVITPLEAQDMVLNILEDLEAAGFKISPKNT